VFFFEDELMQKIVFQYTAVYNTILRMHLNFYFNVYIVIKIIALAIKIYSNV